MSASNELTQADAVSRLFGRDVSLFARTPEVAVAVENRLGWVGLASASDDAVAHAAGIAAYADEIETTDVVLLGMGGSSLASLVLDAVLPANDRRLHVLDTVAPISVEAVLERTHPATTLYLLASKSGATIEPNSLYAIFRARADEVLGRQRAGMRFVAITDPGTVAETRARDEGFGRIVSAPADVGGRFSALTVFGLIPTALIGADTATLVERAAQAERRCGGERTDSAGTSNPASELAAFMVDALRADADKLTLMTSEGLEPFGLWVEQLVAESLGKSGHGIVPVIEPCRPAAHLGPDRAIVFVRYAHDHITSALAQTWRATHRVHELVLDGAYDVGAQFVVWEYAVALAGHLMGVNPFDEPNVAEAKAATLDVLGGRATPPQDQMRFQGMRFTFAGGLCDKTPAEADPVTAIAAALGSADDGDYVALLAYLPDNPKLVALLQDAACAVSSRLGRACCTELGPRYLHSTGQLHKGGPNRGVFVMITSRDERDLEIPGEQWPLARLHVAQAEGDLIALASHDRRVLRIDLPDASARSVRELAEMIVAAVDTIATAP